MSHSIAIYERSSNVGQSPEAEKTYTGSSLTKLEEAVPDESSDLEIALAMDVSAIQALYIVSDQNVTLETNSGAAPDDTLNLVANVPYLWTTDSYFANVFGTDITALFLTNSSGSAATLRLWVLTDATP